MTDMHEGTGNSPVESSMIRIGARAFFLAVAIIFSLMMVAGILTRTVPPGSYDRELLEGRMVVVPGSFSWDPVPDYPWWRWFTAPLEVLAAPGNITVITIILFLMFVGGSFTVLERGDILGAFLRTVAVRMRHRRFLLMALLQLFFMLTAAVLGIFEAMVPLVVFVVPLAVSLGWDPLTGLGMSLLPLAFGFSAAMTNPFTIGVAQTVAELPLFSGVWLRAIFFVVTYVAVLVFVRRHAQRVEQLTVAHQGGEHPGNTGHKTTAPAVSTPLTGELRRSLTWFGGSMSLAVIFILVTSRSPNLSTYAFPLMAVLFLVGGLGAGRLSGMTWKNVGGGFASGFRNMIPGVVLILMSMSVKHIVESGGIMDTILHGGATLIARHPPVGAAFMMYGAVLVMNFFIGSASAKAFLMMPILTPLADLVGLTRQTAVLAFGFGDGFSNMLYPTNALLIIGLSFTTVSYPRWVRWTIPLQVVMAAVTALFLAVAVRIGYGPF